MLGHEAVLLATMISEPDLQKGVKNSAVLAKPFSICVCVCVRARMFMHQLLKRQIAPPPGASWGQTWRTQGGRPFFVSSGMASPAFLLLADASQGVATGKQLL